MIISTIAFDLDTHLKSCFDIDYPDWTKLLSRDDISNDMLTLPRNNMAASVHNLTEQLLLL